MIITLDEYKSLLRQIDTEIKEVDIETAYNVARELSVIYLKLAYNMVNKDYSDRLESLGRYIEKTLPNKCPGVIGMLHDIISRLEY